MKKGKSGNPISARKRGVAARTVDDYLAGVPESARETLHKMRATIRSVVPPEAKEIISYGIPAFKHKRVLVWYAAFAHHCSLFPTAAVIDEFKDELSDLSTSKGTIQFPTDKPLPVALIRRLVKTRVARSEDNQEH